MKFSIRDFFSKCDQIRRKLWIWSHLLKKFLMENFISGAVLMPNIFSRLVVFYLFHNNNCSVKIKSREKKVLLAKEMKFLLELTKTNE